MATVRPGHHPATTALLLFLLLACPTLQQLQASPLDARPQSDDDIFQIFLKWVLEYGRVYRSLLEQQRRFNIFRDNLLYILDINDRRLTYELGLNNFTDITLDEFEGNYMGVNPPEPDLVRSAPAATKFVYADVEAANAVDWRDKGAVTEVKSQGKCGGCWTFASTGALEGVHKIKKGELLNLSQQQLLDCCTGGDYKSCVGCKGGWMEQAFSYVKANGLRTEKDYPYKGSSSFQCKKTNGTEVRIDGVGKVPFNKQVEDNLLKAVSEQPVAVTIDARSRDLQLYKGGIFRGDCYIDPTHAVLVVGYGTTRLGVNYWILKNSWGTSWGEKGYIRLPRGFFSGTYGTCGMYQYASFPIINDSKELQSSI